MQVFTRGTTKKKQSTKIIWKMEGYQVSLWTGRKRTEGMNAELCSRAFYTRRGVTSKAWERLGAFGKWQEWGTIFRNCGTPPSPHPGCQCRAFDLVMPGKLLRNESNCDWIYDRSINKPIKPCQGDTVTLQSHWDMSDLLYGTYCTVHTVRYILYDTYCTIHPFHTLFIHPV